MASLREIVGKRQFEKQKILSNKTRKYLLNTPKEERVVAKQRQITQKEYLEKIPLKRYGI